MLIFGGFLARVARPVKPEGVNVVVRSFKFSEDVVIAVTDEVISSVHKLFEGKAQGISKVM